MSVVSTSGNHYDFPLQDFISGATIANIVARAKKQAIKRALNTKQERKQGICLADLTKAMRQEFEENKEPLALNRLQEERGTPNEFVQLVDINMENGTTDPWSEEKLHPYRNKP
jgi:hypothetical protein